MAAKKVKKRASSKKKTEEKKESEDKKKEEKREEVIDKINENIDKSEEKEEKREESKPDKKQIFEENKILKVFLGIIFLIVVVIVSYLIFYNSSKAFTYEGIKYVVDTSGQSPLYDTVLPLKTTNYNVYLRNDPRTLAKTVPFNGTFYLKPYMALNYSNDIHCSGYGTVAVVNLMNLYDALGTKVVYDPNATCDPQQRYVDVNIRVANETSIQEIAPACYNINVANCDVIPATERYMTETISEVYPYLVNSS